MVAFDLTSWYAIAIGLAAAYLLWRQFLSQSHSDVRAIIKRLRPDPPPRARFLNHRTLFLPSVREHQPDPAS